MTCHNRILDHVVIYFILPLRDHLREEISFGETCYNREVETLTAVRSVNAPLLFVIMFIPHFYLPLMSTSSPNSIGPEIPTFLPGLKVYVSQ